MHFIENYSKHCYYYIKYDIKNIYIFFFSLFILLIFYLYIIYYFLQDIEQIFIDNHNYHSPLFHLKWWRICFADGQFSDLVHTEKHYKIIQSLQSTHKWIIPSTLEKSDIFGNIFGKLNI